MADDPEVELDPFEEKSVNVIDWGRLIFTFVLLLALLILVGIYLFAALTVKEPETWTRTKDAFQVILPVVTGLLGTVVAFYFGKPKS